MTYAGYNQGWKDGIITFIKFLVGELVLMEKRSKGILLNKGQVGFLKKYLTRKDNIKCFLELKKKGIK